MSAPIYLFVSRFFFAPIVTRAFTSCTLSMVVFGCTSLCMVCVPSGAHYITGHIACHPRNGVTWVQRMLYPCTNWTFDVIAVLWSVIPRNQYERRRKWFILASLLYNFCVVFNYNNRLNKSLFVWFSFSVSLFFVSVSASNRSLVSQPKPIQCHVCQVHHKITIIINNK